MNRYRNLLCIIVLLCLVSLASAQDSLNVRKLGQIALPAHALGVAVVGNYAYVADEIGGLRIIDVSNPSTPIEVGVYGNSDWVHNVAISGNYAYLADDQRGLRIVDISNPATPTAAGIFNTPGSAQGVVVSDTLAYIADEFGGLRIINISNPVIPTELGTCLEWNGLYGIAVFGRYAYVTNSVDDEEGLYIVNVSNPLEPIVVGRCDAQLSYELTVAGNYAYLAAGSRGLVVINISDLTTPTNWLTYETQSSTQGVAISGNNVFVADYGDGLRVINIANPDMPAEAGSYDTPGHAQGVCVVGTIAYVADDNYLGIYDCSAAILVPWMDIQPKSLSFGYIPVNQDSSIVLSIRNLGVTPLVISSATSPLGFTQLLTLPLTVPVGDSVTDTIRFQPIAEQPYSGNLVFTTNVPIGPISMVVSGIGSPPLSLNHVASDLPTAYSLEQNYPNPFNPATSITFDLPKPGMTKLTVFNLSGQAVAELVNSHMEAGHHQFEFNGNSLASGVYICKLQSESFSATRKMMLLK